jgi:hypothetical protein
MQSFQVSLLPSIFSAFETEVQTPSFTPIYSIYSNPEVYFHRNCLQPNSAQVSVSTVFMTSLVRRVKRLMLKKKQAENDKKMLIRAHLLLMTKLRHGIYEG